jgi:uncharacterized membrane protein YkoI
MSEENVGNVEQEESASVQSQTEDHVSYDSYKKAVDQHKRSKGRVLEMQQQLDSITEELGKYRAKDKEVEQRKLEEKGEFDKILQSYKNEIRSLTDQIESGKAERLNRTRKDAFLASLPGPLHNDDYINLAKLNDIAVDKETGEIDPITLKEAVDGFVSKHPALMKLASEESAASKRDVQAQAPKPVNLNKLDGSDKQLSPSELYKQLRLREEGLLK